MTKPDMERPRENIWGRGLNRLRYGKLVRGEVLCIREASGNNESLTIANKDDLFLVNIKKDSSINAGDEIGIRSKKVKSLHAKGFLHSLRNRK